MTDSEIRLYVVTPSTVTAHVNGQYGGYGPEYWMPVMMERMAIQRMHMERRIQQREIEGHGKGEQG